MGPEEPWKLTNLKEPPDEEVTGAAVHTYAGLEDDLSLVVRRPMAQRF